MDAVLVVCLLVGTTLGARLGARTVEHLNAAVLKLAFSMMVLAMSLKFLNDLFAAPPAFLVALGGHG